MRLFTCDTQLQILRSHFKDIHNTYTQQEEEEEKEEEEEEEKEKEKKEEKKGLDKTMNGKRF